jgi:thiol-disulfide isomerase/thioredoxin
LPFNPDSMKRFFLTVFLLIFAIISLAQTPLTTAIQFEAKDFNGNTHNLFNYLDDGKYVILSFYTMNCGSCQTYSPGVSAIYEQFGCNNAGLVVLGINWGATNSQLLEYHQQYGWDFPALSGIDGYGNEITQNYLVESFITVILIAPNREIVNQYIDPPTTSVLENLLLSYGLSTTGCMVGTQQVETSQNKLLFVFPNPAKSYFSFSAGSLSGNYHVSLYDLNGKRVKDYGFNSLPSSVFPLHDVNAGVYMVRAWNDEVSVQTSGLMVLP